MSRQASTAAIVSVKPMGGRLHLFAIFLLMGLLLVLALRLTMTESLYQSFQQESAQFVARLHPPDRVLAPEIGPAVTLGLSAVTLLLSALAAGLAVAAGAFTLGKAGRFVLIGAILALGMLSTLAAANRFAALVGLSDLATALVAVWAISVLCHPAILGSTARRMVIAALVAILAVWSAKGLYQRAVEIPDTIDYYVHHKEESLAAQGMLPSDPGVKLYESRMFSREVTGYVTLSNVMGAGMIGLLAAIAGLLAARIVSPVEVDEHVAPRKRQSGGGHSGGEISVATLLVVIAVLLVLLGLLTLFLTGSRGGSILAVAGIGAILFGGYFWKWVIALRRAIIITLVVVATGTAAGVLAFGITHDRLPSKSLMFRWHYWTASVPLIKQHAMTGVGLNNFGDYYASVKRATSPETVSDPHSFFVRLAAEMGIPATCLIGLLIAWSAISATRVARIPDGPASPDHFVRFQFVGVLFCVGWWIVHQFLAETAQSYSFILSFLGALIAFCAWSVAGGILFRLDARGLRTATVALLVGALGMLAYDQINMALVTGPVAMLFWIMLGAADSYDGPVKSAASVKAGGGIGAALLGAGAIGLAIWTWYPSLTETMPWDARLFIDRYCAAVMMPPQSPAAAKTAITEAIARNPRSVALRRQLMLLKEQLGEPVDEDAKVILSLDHTDIQIRYKMAGEKSSLSAAERARILNDVLRLDAQLPEGEVMHLTDEQKSEIRAALAQLQPATSPASAP